MASEKDDNAVKDNEDQNAFGFKINQLGIVVKDIEKSSAFLKKIGIGPFASFDAEGETGKFTIALFDQSGLQIELIQPPKEDKDSIYSKFLKERGEGLHHVGCYVKDYDDAYQHMADLGIPVLVEGDVYGINYCYYDTEKECGFITELIKDPNT